MEGSHSEVSAILIAETSYKWKHETYTVWFVTSKFLNIIFLKILGAIYFGEERNISMNFSSSSSYISVHFSSVEFILIL